MAAASGRSNAEGGIERVLGNGGGGGGGGGGAARESL